VEEGAIDLCEVLSLSGSQEFADYSRLSREERLRARELILGNDEVRLKMINRRQADLPSVAGGRLSRVPE